MELQLAKGMKDVLPEEKILKQKIISQLKEIFELYGFNPLETPAIERYDILASKYAGGSEILKETFRLNDQGGRELALRYDLTVPFARVIGMNPQLRMPWKRYQIDKVWRDGPMGLGRYREFWQCDVDIVGCKEEIADAEILALADDVFKRLNLKAEILVNNIKVLHGILEQFGVKNKEEAILSLDKLRKTSSQAVIEELAGKGIDRAKANEIIRFISTKAPQDTLIKKLKAFITNHDGLVGVHELESLFKYCRLFNAKNLKLDLSLARGLVFYTGAIFEAYLTKSRITSAVAAGGRYDHIVGKFLESGNEHPCVGISFGLDRIYDALCDNSNKHQLNVTKAFIIPIKTAEKAIRIMQALRKSNIKTDMDIVGRNISKNLDHANKEKIPYVIFIGEKELKKNKIKLRDMRTGRERLLTIQQACKILCKE